jgi:hypothetical protein
MTGKCVALLVAALGFGAIAEGRASASEWVTLRTNVDARSFAGDWLVSTDLVAGKLDYYVKYWNGSQYVVDTANGGLGTPYVAGTTVTVGADLVPAMIRADGHVFRRDLGASGWTAFPHVRCADGSSFAARRSNGTLRSYLASGFGTASPYLFAIADGANDTDVYFYKAASACWQKTSLAAEQVSISPEGTVWAVTSTQAVYSYDMATNVWTPYSPPYQFNPKKISGGTALLVNRTQATPVTLWTSWGKTWNLFDDTYRQYTSVLPDAVAGYWNNPNPDFQMMLVYSKTERVVRVWTMSD